MIREAWLCAAVLAGAICATTAFAAPADAPTSHDVHNALRDRLTSLHPGWYDPDHDTWRSVPLAAPKRPPERGATAATGQWVTGVAWLLAVLLVAALAWLAWHLIPREAIGAAQAGPAGKPQVDVQTTLLQLEPGETDDPETALAAAKQAGNWSRAIVWLYAILLMRLDRAGIVRVRRGATNRRYRLEVADWTESGRALRASTPDLLETVDAAIAAFECAFFGHQPADRVRVETLETRIRHVLATVGNEVTR